MTTQPSRRHPSAFHAWVVAGLVFVVTACAAALLVWSMEQRRVQSERARVDSIVADRAHAIQSMVERALSSTYALSAMVHQAGANSRILKVLPAKCCLCIRG